MSKLASLSANDCSPFEAFKPEGESTKKEKRNELRKQLIQNLIAESGNSTIFSFKQKETEKEPLAYYDYKDKKWKAHRFIGSALVKYNFDLKEDIRLCKVEIKPRFGEGFLAYMLEKSFDIKFKVTKSQDEGKQKKQETSIIDKIIGLIWLIKLNHANRYGLPTTRQLQTHRGYQIKGRLDTRHTAIAYHTSREAVSHYQEKITDPVVAAILGQAYMLLKQHNQFSDSWLQDAALDAVTHLKKTGIRQKWINPADYHNIRYRSLYTSYKDVVDMSWDIIRNRQIQQHIGEREGYGFFLDMAQIWELYLKSLLKRELKDWKLVEANHPIYQKQFYDTQLIPDIVFVKDGKYIVLDAKWKKMTGKKEDVDRADMHQIHTYISYFQHMGKVVLAGLIYPLSGPIKEEAPYLFGNANGDTKFIISGIDLSSSMGSNDELKAPPSDQMKEREDKFLRKIRALIDTTE